MLPTCGTGLQALLQSKVRAAWAGWSAHVEERRAARQHAAGLQMRAVRRLQHQVPGLWLSCAHMSRWRTAE